MIKKGIAKINNKTVILIQSDNNIELDDLIGRFGELTVKISQLHGLSSTKEEAI
jgi:hypothetical protein